MGSRLSHLIVDDFNDYAALLGMNTSYTDTVPIQNGLAQESSRNAYEDSAISMTNQRNYTRAGDKAANQIMGNPITRETFK